MDCLVQLTGLVRSVALHAAFQIKIVIINIHELAAYLLVSALGEIETDDTILFPRRGVYAAGTHGS